MCRLSGYSSVNSSDKDALQSGLRVSIVKWVRVEDARFCDLDRRLIGDLGTSSRNKSLSRSTLDSHCSRSPTLLIRCVESFPGYPGFSLLIDICIDLPRC